MLDVHRASPRAASVLALAAALLAGAAVRPASAQRVDEYRLKAAVLYNLTKFVDWPADAFPSAKAPFVICVLGADPFGPVLEESLAGRLVGSRAIVAKRIAEIEAGCHVLFVSNSEIRRLPSIMDRLRDASVLTVGELSGFVDRGGVIGLVTEDDRVTFEINAAAAAHARLKISARLMALAASIRRTEGQVR